jgi:hypothetical protein
MDPGTPQKLNRSCEECRTRKIRCQPESGTASKCSRCEKLQLRCTFVAPVTRRRRLRANGRIDDLENELKELRRKIDGHEGTSATSSRSTSDAEIVSGNGDPARLDSNALLSSSKSTGLNLSNLGDALDQQDARNNEQVCSGLLDDSVQQTLLQRFVRDLSPHMPFFDVLKGQSLAEIRREYPCTLLAILAASSTGFNPGIALPLVKELDAMCAEQVIIRGQKSVDLTQAMLINAIWYHPPDRFQDLKFTQYTHIAANMALDLRLGELKPMRGSASNDTFEAFKRNKLFLMTQMMCSRYDYTDHTILSLSPYSFQHGLSIAQTVDAPLVRMVG